jgi:hypothetical protein
MAYNRTVLNNNRILYPQSNSEEINKAFSTILNELRRKDNIIKELELKVQTLEIQIKEFEKMNNIERPEPTNIINPNIQNYLNGKNYENFQNKNQLNTPMSTPSVGGNNPKVEVIKFLKEVKQKVDTKTFIDFTKYIKLLKNESENKNEILQRIKILFQPYYNDLYEKLEFIISK